jgi:hypothetical protein
MTLRAVVAAFPIASQISGQRAGEPTGGGDCTPNHNLRMICRAVFGATAQNCFIGAANLSER